MTDEQIIGACKKYPTMLQASKKLNLPFTSFKRMAKRLKVYKINQGGKGCPGEPNIIVPLEEILQGKHPNYHRYHLKRRLLKKGILKNECSICAQKEMWNDKSLTMIIDHINGINNDHKRENLRMVCPNCDSQLDTFCGRNINGGVAQRQRQDT